MDTKRKPRMDANDHAGFRRPRERAISLEMNGVIPKIDGVPRTIYSRPFAAFLFVSIRGSHRPAGQGPRDIRQRAI